MTIATSTNRVDYTGNGSTTVFSFSFRIFANSDLVVTSATPAGVETTLVLGTDYTVSGAGSYNGGSVTLTTALTNGHALTILRELDITQDTDLRNQGSFFAETHEDVFDRQTMIMQQLQEQIDRSAKLPITSTEDAEALVADIVLLADISADISTVAANIADVQNAEENADAAAASAALENADAAAASAALANDWATKTSGAVAGGEYSAKYHATAAASSASSASSSASNAATSESNASSSASSASSSASSAAASAAAAASALDSFDDRYLGSKSAAPTLDNDGNALVAGALYFNNGTVTAGDKGMWVYDGAAWIEASAAQEALLVSYEYVATAAQTTFSGADANTQTLSYVPGAIIVAQNGAILRPGDEYTASNGTSVVLATGAALNDEIVIYTFATFTVANTYTIAQADAAFQAKDADTAKTDVVQTFTVAQRGAVVALTDGATITPDFAAANNFSVTLGGNRTLANPTNLVAGQSGVIKITQDATGSRTLAFGSYWDFAAGTAPTLTTTANAVDILAYYVDSSTNITARLLGDRR
jgi:hypothetical protein